ncbi:MAG: flagellin FliC3 [Lachnospiraceae bacterium]|nr:flagellin FliC3 [Lachnospiraceae bacterium]
MRINYNATAMRANNALNVADNRVSSSLLKLSSGLKVNRAKDNPSGYAIGRRMDAQIEGVSVATRNANTGISIIETSDGALTEVHEMLQRMNELAIKGATGTLTTADRATLDAELVQLKKEVTRIAKDTEFNGQTLLDGTFDLKGYTNDLSIKVGYYSDDVLVKKYEIDALTVVYNDDGKIDLDKTKATFVPGANFPKGSDITSVGENCVTITDGNGFEITLDIFEDNPQLMILTENNSTDTVANVRIMSDDDPIFKGDFSITLEYDGGTLKATPGNDATAKFLDGATINRLGNDVSISKGDEEITVQLTNDAVDLLDGTNIGGNNPNPGTQSSINVSLNLEVEYHVESKDLELDITGIGAMDTQIGANEGQTLAIRIPTISLQRLGLTGANLMTQDSSSDAIVAVKSAIAYVSAVRSRLGAYQNRLEHTVSSLDITNENMTAAYSRIMDVDMSEEMTTYTSQQVVSQAAVSMLAQANERPSQLLQLLQ